MRLDDFDFTLPDDLVAVRPVRPRRAARLLVADRVTQQDAHIGDLPNLLSPGDRLIFNDTKVRPLRLSGERRRPSSTGSGVARVEVTLLEPAGGDEWQALVRPLRKVAQGEEIVFAEGFSARLVDRGDTGAARIALKVGAGGLDAALEAHGVMPLPPYIAGKRAADAQDRDDYQSIFAARVGAAAAPTASLHFDDVVLKDLADRGIASSTVTLHVGAGTFLPVKVDDPRDHRMHAEWGEITDRAAAEIAEARAVGGRIIPVGTTALRLLETAARETGQVVPWSGETDIFIYPGFQFRAADGLITNFHLPKSTLMMLVAAFIGTERIRQIYAHAVGERYRFFSYGDASLLLPGGM